MVATARRPHVRRITQPEPDLEPGEAMPRHTSTPRDRGIWNRKHDMSAPADKTGIRPVTDAEFEQVSGGWAGMVAFAQAHATTEAVRSSSVINQNAISLPKPAYPAIS